MSMLTGQSKSKAAKDRADAARYRFLRDDGHLDFLDPDDRNTKVPARVIDRAVDRWIREHGKRVKP